MEPKIEKWLQNQHRNHWTERDKKMSRKLLYNQFITNTKKITKMQKVLMDLDELENKLQQTITK
jgi:hypothetical protein